MAKYGNHVICTNCGQRARLTLEAQEGDTHQTYNGPWAAPSLQYVTLECQCNRQPFHGSIDFLSYTAKDNTTVTKQFDTTEVKNTALNTIVSKIQAVERAQFDRIEAVAKVETLHAQKIADSAIALDRVLMEALQNGLDMDDLDLYLPEYSTVLERRVNDLTERTSLDHVSEGV